MWIIEWFRFADYTHRCKHAHTWAYTLIASNLFGIFFLSLEKQCMRWRNRENRDFPLWHVRKMCVGAKVWKWRKKYEQFLENIFNTLNIRHFCTFKLGALPIDCLKIMDWWICAKRINERRRSNVRRRNGFDWAFGPFSNKIENGYWLSGPISFDCDIFPVSISVFLFMAHIISLQQGSSCKWMCMMKRTYNIFGCSRLTSSTSVASWFMLSIFGYPKLCYNVTM